jgi:hypothetical protein
MESFREALRLDPTSEWARLGIIEAMKAKNIVYRWLLKFFLWMAKLSGRAQWMVIIGLYIVYQLLRMLAAKNPSLAPFIWPFTTLYAAFALMTWIATPLFNVVLLTSRFGRHALNREEKVAAAGVGILLTAGITLAAISFLADDLVFLVAGFVVGVLAFPFATIFKCHKGRPRNFVIAYSVGMAILGAVGIALLAFGVSASVKVGQLYLIALFIFFFVGNAAAMSRPAR